MPCMRAMWPEMSIDCTMGELVVKVRNPFSASGNIFATTWWYT